MVTSLMLKGRGFIWMLAYKEKHVLSASKPGKERLAQHQRHRFKIFDLRSNLLTLGIA